MSFIVKGIDLPSKDKSPLVITVWADGIVCCVDSGGGIEETTSAIQIPTPHGRLIDASTETTVKSMSGKAMDVGMLLIALKQYVPTILEEEK